MANGKTREELIEMVQRGQEDESWFRLELQKLSDEDLTCLHTGRAIVSTQPDRRGTIGPLGTILLTEITRRDTSKTFTTDERRHQQSLKVASSANKLAKIAIIISIASVIGSVVGWVISLK